MKRICYLLVIFQLLIVSSALAQQNTTPKSTTENNEKFVIHKISKGETIFSICKKYNCDEKELKAANPQLINGLKTGETLNIPITLTDKTQKDSVKKKVEFINHKVKKGETIYSITKLYNVTQETIWEFNPDAKNGVKSNQVLRIPTSKDQTTIVEQTPVKKEIIEKIEYTQHEIEQGETFYSLQRKYGITKEQLMELNPSLQDGLQVGENIKLPVVKTDDNKEARNAYTEHQVETGETVYSISVKYNIKDEDLKELNPELKERGLISGETIFIPKHNNPVTEGSATSKQVEVDETQKDFKKQSKLSPKKEYPNLSRDTFRITMFLPLFLNQNETNNSSLANTDENSETDSTQHANADNSANSNNTAERSLIGHSRNFLSFYEGFLIALDTMKNTGVNIRLDLFDNRFEQKVVDSVLRHTDIVNSDLIVGPVDVKHQKNISAFSAKNQIPLVSPFSSDDDYTLTNSFYFQINPTKDFILRKTADFIGKEYCDKNIIILSPGSYEQIKGADLVETVRDKVKYYASKKNVKTGNFNIIDINEGGNQGYWLVKKSMKPDVENIVFIPPSNNRTEREAILSRAINSLYVLSEEFQITLVGMNDYPTFKSINTEYFHKLNLHYVTPNFVDYQDREVVSFIKNYRKQFLTEPNQFSYRGYDIAKFFIEAYRQNSRNFVNKISSVNTNTLQSNFKPKRIKDFSGFMNKTLFVVNFTPEYEVKVVSIISE